MRLMYIFLFLLLLAACQPKEKEQPQQDSEAVEQTAITEEQVKQFDYNSLYGIYDHESTTASFGAIVAISQNGLDLYFTVSSVQGTCKAETEGVIVMAEHAENFYIGFANVENCPLQFTFYPDENKVDIKEVTLCTIHGSTCSFEGVYLKRRNE